jgi:hypothetical protein
MPTPRLATALPLLALLVSSRALADEPRSSSVGVAAASDSAAKQEAARRFEHAIKLYEEGDYTLALAEFERVYQLVPDYRVLYNIGQVSIQLGRYARAFRTLKEYLSRGAAELSPDRAAAVQADLTQLAGKVARVTVQIEPAGAQVNVDGVAAGRSPLSEPLVVDVGEHQIQIELPGYVTQSQTFIFTGGDRRDAAFALQPAPAVVATAAPSGQRDKPRAASPSADARATSNRGTWLGLGWTATGALTAGAIISGALGASAAGDLRDLKGTATTRDELEHAQTRARTRLLVADVLGAAALATGVVTLYVQLSGPTREKPAPHAAGSRFRVSLGPSSVALAFEN